jgi:hypothetical protein
MFINKIVDSIRKDESKKVTEVDLDRKISVPFEGEIIEKDGSLYINVPDAKVEEWRKLKAEKDEDNRFVQEGMGTDDEDDETEGVGEIEGIEKLLSAKSHKVAPGVYIIAVHI